MKQSDRGQSLIDQERAFARAAERNGWQRARAYAEAASAKSHDARATFQRMISELDETLPDVIVVYSLDRFTRNLREGLNELDGLRGKGVKLLACDWDEPRAIDMDKDADWAVVVAAFTEAEAERRRIARRIRRSYEGRRERGEAAKNRVCYGLRIVDKAIAPDPDLEWIIRDLTAKFLEGIESVRALHRWARSVDPNFPPTHYAARHILKSRDFVAAGLRTDEEQARIDAHFGALSEFASRKRKMEHEFTGVFRCETCGRILHSGAKRGRDGIACGGKNGGWCRTFLSDRLRPLWLEFLASVDTHGWADGYSAEAPDDAARRLSLERRLAQIGQEEAALEGRRNAAFDLYGSGGAVKAQAEKMLTTIDREEKALEAARQAVLGELSAGRPERVDTDAVRAAVRELLHNYERLPIAERNRLNRLIVQELHCYPTVARKGRYGVAIQAGSPQSVPR